VADIRNFYKVELWDAPGPYRTDAVRADELDKARAVFADYVLGAGQAVLLAMQQRSRVLARRSKGD
jgi:hypothetical protein